MDTGNAANTIEFNHFDVVPEASDHYYRAKKTFTNQSNAHIMKEWKILKKNLPDSIYVQVYETRIDLLRAVIIGSPGTPYHDGLFFFDILLPYGYPNKPPMVYYHSHGYRLNPNLYANGKLCLSLINTWFGRKSETWTKGSTLLQVLVSIQGLVLNETPYFNEPAYGRGRYSKSQKWVKPSLRYNEVAFILSCYTTLHIVRKPPKNFESFVYQHFRLRAASILRAVKDYKAGRLLVGQSRMNGNGISSSSSSSVKAGRDFQAKLVPVYNQLKIAFAAIGFELSKYENAEEGEEDVITTTTTTTTSNSSQVKQGCFMNLWGSISSRFLGN